MSRFLAQAGIECIIFITDLGLTVERVLALKGVNVIAVPILNKRYYLAQYCGTKSCP
jgi:hypothetical protein